MSKERAKRRAEREASTPDGSGATRAQAEATLAARTGASVAKAPAKPTAKSGTKPSAKARPKSAPLPWWRRLFQPRHGRRRFSRRTRAQRAMVVFTVVGVLGLIWLLVDDWGVRIALGLVAVFATPALVTMALGRSHR